MREVTISPAEIPVGQQVVVWWISGENRGCGQGGRFESFDGTTIRLSVGATEHAFVVDETVEVRTEVALDPSECLEYGDGGECRGPVDYHSTGSSMRSWPRCEGHAEARQERYETSIERYADSDLAPSWLDPSYAGESWDGG